MVNNKHCSEEMYKHFRSGKMIEPLNLDGNENVKDFITNVFGNSGFNARRLFEACKIFDKMIENDATICLTLSGAMTPIGMSGPIIKLIEKGFIDFIISTGANLYHDLHRPFGYPMKQGDFKVDDSMLEQCGIARIYDVYIEDSETLLATDKVILDTVRKRDFTKFISTSDLHYFLGKEVAKSAPHPEKSLLVAAYNHNVPVYTSSPGDSSIAMNLILPHFYDEPISIDPLMDILETAALVWKSDKNGAIEIGGGSPKNFYMQTQPTLWQILGLNKGGHDFFIQLTTDSPQWGGLSGATPQEAISWGKLKEETRDYAVVYSDASITFPLLAQYANMTHGPRKHKELFKIKDSLAKELLDEAKQQPALQERFKSIFKYKPGESGVL
ncbi:MAG: deoxyhypusine synthase [Nanoarchaeota archaeon]|nr:deoxyhypusine synthase [Nanoarchaeota archaeon]